MEKTVLSVVDYILLILMLLVSAAIGLYFKFSGGQQKTITEYMLAGKNMPILPVAFSIMASFHSAISVIGTPAEVYMFGIFTFLGSLIYPIGIALASYVCLPVYFNLGACTVYEYLEKRFGNLTRSIASFLFVLQTMLFMSVALYAPSLALSAATNLSTWTSVISIGAVCTFYCTLGGMKAVLWTDLFQSALMIIGICAVIMKGFLDIGFSEVFEIGYEGGRINFPTFSLSLTERYTFWNILFLTLTIQLATFGANQIQIQRLLTLKNISACRKSLYYGISLSIFYHVLTTLVGLVIYAHFSKCDPLTAPNKPILAGDQIFPYYVITVLGSIPGLPGLCICGIFSAALSSVSSGLNCLSAVTMQDLVRPYLVSRKYSESTMAFIAKVLTLFFGVLCILMTFMAALFGNLVQAATIAYGMCGFPVLSVFLLGMLTTRTNEKGALIGLLSSLSMTAWVTFGASAYRSRPKILPLSTEGCPDFSFSNMTSSSIFNSTVTSFLAETSKLSSTTAVPRINKETPYIFPLYKLSYMWYGPLGLLTGVVVGYISSIIISRITGVYLDVADEFVSPVFIKLFGRKKGFKGKESKIQEREETKSSAKIASIYNSTV